MGCIGESAGGWIASTIGLKNPKFLNFVEISKLLKWNRSSQMDSESSWRLLWTNRFEWVVLGT
jgi:hypothetical protein